MNVNSWVRAMFDIHPRLNYQPPTSGFSRLLLTRGVS